VIRLAVRVREEHAEIVLAELLDLAPSGVEESRSPDGTVEFAVYGAPGEQPRMPDVHAAAGDALVEVSTSEIADDWSERWRSFHRPVLIHAPHARAATDVARAEHVPSIGVRPPWIDSGGFGEEAVEEIVIDPAQAFGTGSHATTRLCLELLLAIAAHDRARGPALDIGTGSGVLAIAAARLGFAPVLALDNERESVAAARANAAANGAQLDVRAFDLRTEAPPAVIGAARARPRVVLANLLAPLLELLAQALDHAPPNLIIGGLLSEQADDVVRAFAQRLDLHERERLQSAGWTSSWLVARS
jgi:ribosomal protein L11 methyltransferase